MPRQNNIIKTAETIAQELVRLETDPNEVAGTLATLRSNPNGPNFFRYLDTVVSDGRAVVRSGRTLDYYRSIRDVCRRHLQPYQEEPQTMAEILGWAVRLMRYYKAADRLEQPPPQRTLAAPLVQRASGQVDVKLKQPPPRATQAAPLVERASGQLKWFNVNKGYGFIRPDGGGKDLFLHHSQLPADFKAPPDGARVTFVVGQGPKGPVAEDVQPV